ncbi:MAG: TlpA family protein disulfide reductase [Alphaproteobacteria bacterium]
MQKFNPIAPERRASKVRIGTTAPERSRSVLNPVHEGNDPAPSGNDYRYKRVTPKVLMSDFRFKKTAPRAGDPLPELELVTTRGEPIKTTDLFGPKPLLLVLGSVSCPMTASSIAPLKRLYAEFGEKVAFLTLYVREAHPAEHYPQPETAEEKLAHARILKEQHEIPWTVAADDIDGTLHRGLDSKPNAAYLIDVDGTIAFRALWAGDEAGLRRALASVSHGDKPTKPQSRALFGPLAKGMGYFQQVLDRAGPQAQRDMLRAAPPILLVGRVAALFRPLPLERRGLAALLTIAGSAAVAIGAGLAWFGLQ